MQSSLYAWHPADSWMCLHCLTCSEISSSLEMRGGQERQNWSVCECFSNSGLKELWKYRWLAGELLSRGLIESLCQGGGGNQRTCVFQVEKGHVESAISPTSWCRIRRQLRSIVGSLHSQKYCASSLMSFLLDVQQFLEMSEKRACIVASVASNFITCHKCLEAFNFAVTKRFVRGYLVENVLRLRWTEHTDMLSLKVRGGNWVIDKLPVGL